MGYKVGDEVLIKGEVVEVMGAVPYPTKVKLGKGEDAYLFSNDEICFADKIVKTYADGLSDAWELADKVYEMRNQQRYDVFGTESLAKVMDLSPQEALAKIEAYEKGKSEIKVGDVIKYDNNLCVVVSVFNSTLNAMYADGGTINVFISQCKKTGKHIDIESILKQIGE